MSLRDPAVLLDFESGFERIGMPALAIQIATGAWMAYAMQPDIARWFAFADTPSRLIALKLVLLLTTVLLAIDARFRIIPRLSPATLPRMARRIVTVTVLSVAFVFVGVSFRGGLIS
jgi:hypothetical protein